MSTINSVMLMGRIGQDVKIGTVGANKTAKCELRIATNDSSKDYEKTNWHSIELWGKLAESAAKHLKKGDNVIIEGRLESDSYEKDGQKRTKSYVTAQSWKFGPGNKKETTHEDIDSISVPF